MLNNHMCWTPESFKHAIADFFGFLGQQKQAVNIILIYSRNLIANICLFTTLADTECRYHLFRFGFGPPVNVSWIFSLFFFFGLHQVLRELSGSNLVSLVFGAGRVGYSGFIRAFTTENSCLLCLEMTLMTAMGVNQSKQAKLLSWNVLRW